MPSWTSPPARSHNVFNLSNASWDVMARSIAPDVIAPAAIPRPEPNIAADAELCARVNLYAFSLNVVISMPNQSGVQSKTEPAYNFFDATGVS